MIPFYTLTVVSPSVFFVLQPPFAILLHFGFFIFVFSLSLNFHACVVHSPLFLSHHVFLCHLTHMLWLKQQTTTKCQLTQLTEWICLYTIISMFCVGYMPNNIQKKGEWKFWLWTIGIMKGRRLFCFPLNRLNTDTSKSSFAAASISFQLCYGTDPVLNVYIFTHTRKRNARTLAEVYQRSREEAKQRFRWRKLVSLFIYQICVPAFCSRTCLFIANEWVFSGCLSYVIRISIRGSYAMSLLLRYSVFLHVFPLDIFTQSFNFTI